MHLKKMNCIAIFLAIFITIISCATAPPKVQNGNSSAIAISVLMDSLSFRIKSSRKSGQENVRFDYVFFVKLKSLDDSILKRDVIVSNYLHESIKAASQFDAVDSFIMNVEPGIYAAVGAVGTGRTSGDKFMIYFPKDMVKATIRRVYPNTITYMGKFFLNKVTSFNLFGIIKEPFRMGASDNKNDDPQVFFSENYAFDLLILDGEESVISKYENYMMVLSSLNESLGSMSIEKNFLKKHLKTFAGTKWISKINNRLSILEKEEKLFNSSKLNK
jgi:hypothetical protein